MNSLAFALGVTLALSGSAQAAMLVGAARIPAGARDGVGETLGGFGSGMALVPGSLKHARADIRGTRYPGSGLSRHASGRI